MLDTVTAGLLGTAIGAAAGLLGTIISNSYSLKREKIKLASAQEAEREQWLRIRIQEVAEHCLHHLASLLARRAELKENQSNLDLDKYDEWCDSFTWAQKWLTILLAYCEALSDERYNHFKELVESFANQLSPNLELAEKIRPLVIEFASQGVLTSTIHPSKLF
ncbi:MAG: hypothetical protein AB4372_12685 [Xenococcus sp. (in: cyanobacteria)]